MGTIHCTCRLLPKTFHACPDTPTTRTLCKSLRHLALKVQRLLLRKTDLHCAAAEGCPAADRLPRSIPDDFTHSSWCSKINREYDKKTSDESSVKTAFIDHNQLLLREQPLHYKIESHCPLDL